MTLYNLYLLTQNVNAGYDTYDSCVVVAEDEESARRINPRQHSCKVWSDEKQRWGDYGTSYWFEDSTWARPDQVECRLIGAAHPDLKPGTVVCSSFNAG